MISVILNSDRRRILISARVSVIVWTIIIIIVVIRSIISLTSIPLITVPTPVINLLISLDLSFSSTRFAKFRIYTFATFYCWFE